MRGIFRNGDVPAIWPVIKGYYGNEPNGVVRFDKRVAVKHLQELTLAATEIRGHSTFLFGADTCVFRLEFRM